MLPLNLRNKIVYQHKIDSERCHVKLLDLYFKKLPHDAKGKDVFYLRPLSATPSDLSQPWFMSTSVVKIYFKTNVWKAGMSGNYTNHSFRAFIATKLFQAGVSEKLIQQHAGHHSIEALWQYELTSSTRLLVVSGQHEQIQCFSWHHGELHFVNTKGKDS